MPKKKSLKKKSALLPTPNEFNEKLIIFILAAIQFTHILDFVIVMPLGPMFMEVFKIGAQEFGFIVSIYALSACIFGLIGAFYIDRFDRKVALLTLYIGFIVGTFFCAISPDFLILMLARIVTGGFAGIMGAVVLSIIGDVVPEERRGKATGVIMASFSIASIVGVPAGLYLANSYNWAMPFYALAGISALILFAGYKILPNINIHRENERPKKILETMTGVFRNSNHLTAFLFITCMIFAGFSVIPFISTYMVFNVGLTKEQLPYLFFFGGLFTFFTSQYIGRLSDEFGKPKIFRIVAGISVIPLLLITNLTQMHVAYAVAITTLFMIFVSGRFVPAMAMINSSADPSYRGSFMSINTSLQQLASGAASMTAGIIIVSAPDGKLLNYNLVGILAVICTLICIFLSTKMKSATMLRK